MVSDNGKTSTSASKIIQSVVTDSVVRRHFAELQIEWRFNLERAPWWGGMFERLIRCTKRCLMKMIGRANLTYDELSTLTTDVEAVLNSRPLTYVDSDDFEEPLTPSHLLLGYRVLSLPDPFISNQNDPDYKGTPTDLNRRMKYLMKTSEQLWKRWRTENLQELWESHHHQKLNKGIQIPLREGQIVNVYEDGNPRGLWRVGRIEHVIKSLDGKIRSAEVRSPTKTGRCVVLKRPIQHLYPLEVEPQGDDSSPQDESAHINIGRNSPTPPVDGRVDETVEGEVVMARPNRAAAMKARDRILGWMID